MSVWGLYFVYSVPIVGIIFMQIFLSRKENKRLGLVLPIIPSLFCGATPSNVHYRCGTVCLDLLLCLHIWHREVADIFEKYSFEP